MPDSTDDDLVRRCQGGSDEAFAELVDRYRRLVFGIIARTVGDSSRAEDLAQDVFLRIHRGLPYFRGKARVSTWIYRIAMRSRPTTGSRCSWRRKTPRLAPSSCGIAWGRRSRGCRPTTGCSSPLTT
jgi:hypothetical protein